MTEIRPIRCLLIANRGEIAVRIARTCRSMGIRSAAVFSDADANALHVSAADEAVRIGPAPANESYLRIDRLLEAATLVGADALHPGYGFLSENAALAEACAGAGLTFVGPPASAIAAMGSKIAARAIASSVGVPVIEGYGGESGSEQSLQALEDAGRALGAPLLVKASAGGGGKGMRRVNNLAELPSALAAARREAEAAFGSGALLVERYIETPRHIEFQIFGDHHGHLVHLGERECSLQRRHQKVVEETPSVALTPALREQMGEAAVAIARAVGYVNAGTVEFVLHPSGQFYFLEMNTRLQVEHPVTELTFGIDLVREQIRVAEGRPLSFAPTPPPQRGAAVEVRLYAEDPSHCDLPTGGTLLDWWPPDPLPEGVRLDAGVVTGHTICSHYDPMLAKLIASGEDRTEATRRLVRALEQFSILGFPTNRDALLRILALPEYVEGRIHTHLLAERRLEVAEAMPPARIWQQAAAICTLLRAAAAATHPSVPAAVAGSWRNNPSPAIAPWTDWLPQGGGAPEPIRATWRHRAGSLISLSIAGIPFVAQLHAREGAAVTASLNGRRLQCRVAQAAQQWWVHLPGWTVALKERHALHCEVADGTHMAPGDCISPLPGRVVAVNVKPGDRVERGQRLAAVEAMKMEHPILAPVTGVVEAVLVATGDQVEAGATLLVVHLNEGEVDSRARI